MANFATDSGSFLASILHIECGDCGRADHWQLNDVVVVGDPPDAELYIACPNCGWNDCTDIVSETHYVLLLIQHIKDMQAQGASASTCGCEYDWRDVASPCPCCERLAA